MALHVGVDQNFLTAFFRRQCDLGAVAEAQALDAAQRIRTLVTANGIAVDDLVVKHVNFVILCIAAVERHIVAAAAIDRIIAGTTGELVISAAAVELIRPGIAEQRIVGNAAIEDVITGAAANQGSHLVHARRDDNAAECVLNDAFAGQRHRFYVVVAVSAVIRRRYRKIERCTAVCGQDYLIGAAAGCRCYREAGLRINGINQTRPDINHGVAGIGRITRRIGGAVDIKRSPVLVARLNRAKQADRLHR